MRNSINYATTSLLDRVYGVECPSGLSNDFGQIETFIMEWTNKLKYNVLIQAKIYDALRGNFAKKCAY